MVNAKVTSVSDSAVSLSDGQSLPFDYLVLAPGSTYPDPAIKALTGTLADRKAFLKV